MRKLTTNAVAMLLALVGCMGCGNRSASSVDNLIRVDVMADYPEKELILQDSWTWNTSRWKPRMIL